MSKVAEYTSGGYLKPDPHRSNSSILTIEVSIDNDLIEAGFIEKAAIGKQWNPSGSVSAPQHLINWVKQEGANSAIMIGEAEAAAAAAAAFRASVAAKL